MLLDFDTIREEFDSAGADVLELLTDKQRAIEDDPAWIRVACGGRQWGKTTWSGAAHKLGNIAGATSLAIGSTVTKARDLLLPGIEWLNKECGAGIIHRSSAFKFLFPDGGTIQCMGVGSVREADKIRGFTPPFVSVEECGTFKPELLKYMVESCITMAQVKWYNNGGRGMALIGTPGLLVEDYWHQTCRGEFGGSVHHATVHDNPHIPDPDGYLELMLNNYRWTRSTPRFRREFLGEFCAETDSMCYAGWNRHVYPQSAAPTEGYTIMGIDLGALASPSAWIVMRITKEMINGEWRWIVHFIHAEKNMTLTVHDVAAKTGSLKRTFNVGRMRGDGAGLGGQTLETLRTKFIGTFVETAPKAGSKLARIWLMDSMLKVENIRVYEGARPLIDELLSIPFNDDKDDHHPSFPDHGCDAAHYGLELVNQWTKEQSPQGPTYGTAEYEKKKMEQYKRDAVNRHQRDDN